MPRCKKCNKRLTYWSGEWADDTGLCTQCRTPAESFQESSPPPPDGAGNQGGMDFKMLSNFILAFGLILVCIGGFKYASNLPVDSQAASMSANTIQAMNSFVNQIGNNMAVESENQERSFNRGGALNYIGAGSVIIFAGVAVRLSAKKPKSKNAA